jgi:hypothetical protein
MNGYHKTPTLTPDKSGYLAYNDGDRAAEGVVVIEWTPIDSAVTRTPSTHYRLEQQVSNQIAALRVGVHVTAFDFCFHVN